MVKAKVTAKAMATRRGLVKKVMAKEKNLVMARAAARADPGAVTMARSLMGTPTMVIMQIKQRRMPWTALAGTPTSTEKAKT